MNPGDPSKRPSEVTVDLHRRVPAAAGDEPRPVTVLTNGGSRDAAVALDDVQSTEVPLALNPGDPLGTAYRIVRRLGAGGMGVVYLARDLELQRDVAVKVHRAMAGTERLYREAVAMAQLAHPNVVTIHGVGRVNGQLYIAMEYVAGYDLSEWIAAAPRTYREILELMIAAGEGLAAAHAAGFVHRDVKPNNILVGVDGRPRVSDFGLVRAADDAASGTVIDRANGDRTDAGSRSAAATADPVARLSARAEESPIAADLTGIGTAVGTPPYMAPEQLDGRAVDARADQFAFCVVLYEALFGQRPWRGTTIEGQRHEIATLAPRPPGRTEVPATVWKALRRGLARDPAARFPDMRALLAVLRPPPVPARSHVPIAMMAVAGLGVVGLAAIAIAIAWRPDHGNGLAIDLATSCDAAGTPVVAAWGPTARSDITIHYAGLDPSRGPIVARQLAAELDAWSLRWQRAAVTWCQASRARTWSDAVVIASDQCLRRSLDALRALIAKASRGDALVATSALPDVDACADPGELAGETATPAAIEGYWNGDWGPLILRRVGGEIRGVYDHDTGTLRGTLVGDRLVGWWCEAPTRRPPGDAGDFEMRVVVDHAGVRAIAGRWRYGSDGIWDGRWDLKPAADRPPAALEARLSAAGDFCTRPSR